MRFMFCARDETGDFFAIDIGGTNMRMVYVELSDDRGAVVGPQLV